MTIKITQGTTSYNVKLKSPSKLKVTVSSEASSVAGSFQNLSDVNSTGVQDKYIVMYDAATQKYITVNPDEVLSAATTEPIQPGLPNDFVDKLDVDLDDKIDLDAGGF